MKIFKTILAVAVMAMALTGCAKDENVEFSDKVVVTYDVELESVAGTRAVLDGSNINAMDYKMYRIDTNGNAVAIDISGTVSAQTNGSGNKIFPVTLEFLKGQQYKVTFFAYNSVHFGDGQWCKYADANEQEVVFDYTKEAEDVFAGVFTLTSEDTTTSLGLTRPLAQVNLLIDANHIDKAVTLGFNATNAQVNYTLKGMATTYNLLTGGVSGAYSSDRSYNGTFGAVANGYYPMASALVLGGQNVEGKIVSVTGNGFNNIALDKAVPAVPTKANYKTNIRFSSLLTGNVAYEVTLSPTFEGEKSYDENGNEIL